MVGKRRRVVQWRLRQAAISCVQKKARYSLIANENVSANALCAIYKYHGKGLLQRVLIFLYLILDRGNLNGKIQIYPKLKALQQQNLFKIKTSQPEV